MSDSATLAARIVPPPLLGGGGATKMLERNFLVYRRVWLIVFSGFFEPIFYLFSIGVGLGELVGDVAGPGGRSVEYAAFVGSQMLWPGMAAAEAEALGLLLGRMVESYDLADGR